MDNIFDKISCDEDPRIPNDEALNELDFERELARLMDLEFDPFED